MAEAREARAAERRADAAAGSLAGAAAALAADAGTAGDEGGGGGCGGGGGEDDTGGSAEGGGGAVVPHTPSDPKRTAPPRRHLRVPLYVSSDRQVSTPSLCASRRRHRCIGRRDT